MAKRRDLKRPFVKVDSGSLDRTSTSRATRPIPARIAAICEEGGSDAIRKTVDVKIFFLQCFVVLLYC